MPLCFTTRRQIPMDAAVLYHAPPNTDGCRCALPRATKYLWMPSYATTRHQMPMSSSIRHQIPILDMFYAIID